MAARSKKTADTTTNEVAKNNTNGANTNNGSDKQSQMATILVGLLIIASGLLIYNYFQRASAPEVTNQNQQQEDQANNQGENGQDEGNENEDQQEEAKEGQYTVMPGDSLWSIAEKVYGDGFQWQKIADANQLENNAYGQPTVNIGQVINVPDSAATDESPLADAGDEAGSNQEEEAAGTGSTGEKAVAGVQDVQETPHTAIETYTVQHGDTLWSIAEQFYQDGNQWELIYNSPLNDLGTLNGGQPLVHAGNVLVIPQAP